MVLLKIFDDNGFTFFTNSTSRKGGDLKENPHAAMLFYWPMVARQVSRQRISLKISHLPREF